MLNSKKGQIGDTLTWFIATIIIIVILFLSILAPSILWGGSQTRKVINPFSWDLIKNKEVMSYLATPLSGSFVFSQIANFGNLDQNTGSLAVKIFVNNLESIYTKSSFIISYNNNNKVEQLKNPYFESVTVCNIQWFGYTFYCDTLRINNDRRLDFAFSK
ncbi:Uncharacterised protein [uncultured archaeon]|nr:Uncharacterised protein [uncultured archaeon]